MTTSFEENAIKVIPENWKEVIFSDVVDINPKRTLTKGVITKHVAMEYLKPFQKQINNYTLREFKGGSKFQNNDTLFARITPSLENGKTGFVNILDEKETGFGSTEFIVMSARDGKILSNYVYYLSRTSHVRNIAINAMTGTSGRQRVDDAVFDSMVIRIPTEMQEQSRISKILSNFDSKIELLQKQNKILEQIAQTIFKSWFVDFNGVSEFEDSKLGSIPKGWMVISIDKMANFLNGLALQNYPPENDKEFLPVIKIKELKCGITNLSDRTSANIPKKYVVENGDVLFSWSGSLEVVFWTSGKGALNQHLFKVTSTYPKWFYYFWIKKYLPEYRRIAEAKATTMGHIKKEHLTNTLVVIPNTQILQKINQILDPIVKKIIQTNIKLDKISNIRDTLLPKLMSGEIRV